MERGDIRDLGHLWSSTNAGTASDQDSSLIQTSPGAERFGPLAPGLVTLLFRQEIGAFVPPRASASPDQSLHPENLQQRRLESDRVCPEGEGEIAGRVQMGRGLFRIWLVLTIIWAAFVIFASSYETRPEAVTIALEAIFVPSGIIL